MREEEPLELDLNVLPTNTEVFREAYDRGEWSRMHMHRMEMLKTRVRYIRNAEYDPKLAERVMELTNGFSKAYKGELIRIILYAEWEIRHFAETGEVTLGHWKEKRP